MKKPYFLWLILFFATLRSDALDFKITEVLFENTQFPDSDGDYFPWVELRNFSLDTLHTDEYYLTDNINAPRTWRIPSFSISPGQYVIIWFSGKNKIDNAGEIHLAGTLAPTTRTIGVYNDSRQYFADVFSVEYLPHVNQSIGRFSEMNDEWVLYATDLVSKGEKNTFPGKWQQLATKANFSPRDNNPNAALVYRNQFWLLAGETRDEDGVWTPLTDVWRSSDGIKWEMVNPAAPYKHISSFVVFKDKMWAFDEHAYSSEDGESWTKNADNVPFKDFYSRVIPFQDQLINVTERTVYKSKDGLSWEKIAEDAPWESRQLFHLVVFKDTLWLLGGVSNYYTDSTIHYNDIWSSTNGSDWKLQTNNAPWEGRLWPTIMVYNENLWLMGGWNYYYDDGYFSHYGNFNDVWVYSSAGHWEEFKTDRVWPHRHAMYSIVHQNHLFLFAGYGGGGVAHLYNDVWKLDLREVPALKIDAKTLVYGDPPFQLTKGELPARYFADANEVVFAANDENISIGGAGTAKVLIVQGGNAYYYPRDTIVDVRVSKKALKVSVADQRHKYRSSIPEFELEYDGFVYKDDENSLSSKPRAYTVANEFSPVGDYPIQIVTSSDKNYEFITTGATLTISRQSIFSVYPVPSTGVINLSTVFKLSPNAKLEIRNVSGTIVKQLLLPTDADTFTFNFSNVPKGMYLFRLHDIGSVNTGRFIIH
jgi:hypothetical protein